MSYWLSNKKETEASCVCWNKSEYVNPYIPTQTLEEYWSDHMQNHQADSPLYVWPDVWSADLHLFVKNGHTWHRMSLLRPDVIKQHKPNLTKPVSAGIWQYLRWITDIWNIVGFGHIAMLLPKTNTRLVCKLIVIHI